MNSYHYKYFLSKVRGGYSLGQPTPRSAPGHYPGKIYQPILKKKHHLSKWSSYSVTTKQEEVFVPEKPISWWTKISKQIHIFHNFTRRGSALALVVALFSISTLPLQSLSDLSPNFFVGLLKALVPMEFTNIYMMGLNQLYDIGSDKINKPTLPLASGELSVVAGTTIVAISGILGIALAVMFKSPSVLYGVLAWMFFTSVYSTDLPLLRWKQNRFLSLLCLVSIRGLTIPITVFSHVQTYVLGRPLEFTKPAIFSLVIICIFMVVGTFLKDIPDEEGDKAFGMQSLSLIFGRERVFWSLVYIMLGAYAGSIVVGATSSLVLNKIIMVLGHGILACILWIRAKSVNLSDPKTTEDFVVFHWKLLIAEYALIPFVR